MTLKRLRISIKGFVQGVGFRPFIYNLAVRNHLTGWVHNDGAGVEIEVQGAKELVEKFVMDLKRLVPKNAQIFECLVTDVEAVEEREFVIRNSVASDDKCTMVVPDIATCDECLHDILDPNNRRYRYPFTNCTNCGPRFSIIEAMPYDRETTSMKQFPMCGSCIEEYQNPQDRRFHAQPNACPQCGPQLELLNSKGEAIAEGDEALIKSCHLIKEGKILAVKGLGGFHLMVDVYNTRSIVTLRDRKNRPDKPFALMYPNVDAVENDCFLSPLEGELISSKEAPIIILKAKQFPSQEIAPGNPYLGIMLPYTPLHHLMMLELKQPIIATSGNRSNEPICIDEKEAIVSLKGTADYYLVHNRPIIRGADDSIVRVVAGKKMVIRRARGYSSVPIFLKRSLPPSIAFGAHQKNTIAIANGKVISISQHLGDLDTQESCDNFVKTMEKMKVLYKSNPEVVVTDKHPDYFSTKAASALGKPQVSCQHHEAHIYSCVADCGIDPPALGVSWDGTGYGNDGTVWGGEFFRLDEDYALKRVSTFRPFRLLCGEKAVKEPRLVGISLLYEAFGSDLFSIGNLPLVDSFSSQEIVNYEKMLSRGFLSPLCSSVGRLFDGVSSLLGFSSKLSFEGQAAMQLEFFADQSHVKSCYDYELRDGIIDWVPMIRQIIGDIETSTDRADISAKFHNTLVDMILSISRAERLYQVLLSGGVFQNRVLTEKATAALSSEGFQVHVHENIPPNDGGISCGQLVSLLAKTNSTTT